MLFEEKKRVTVPRKEKEITVLALGHYFSCHREKTQDIDSSYLSGHVVFIHPDQGNKICHSTFLLASPQSLLQEYICGDMASLNTKFAI